MKSIKGFDLGEPLELLTLPVHVPQQLDALGKTVRGQTFGQVEARDVESESGWLLRTGLMIEAVDGPRAIRLGIESAASQQEGVTLRAHDAGELSWDDTTGAMNQLLRQHDRGR